MIHRLTLSSSDEKAIIRKLICDDAFSALWDVREILVREFNDDIDAKTALDQIRNIVNELPCMYFYG